MRDSRRTRSGNARVVLSALAHEPMRRLQLASAAWSAGEAAYLVGVFIFAYAKAGHMGDAGVGLLTAAIGLGGLVGGAVAVALIGHRRLAPWFVVGIAVWSLAIALVGAVPIPLAAAAFLTVGGIGKVLIDVAGSSVLQRSISNDMRTQALGLQEGLVTAALAIGAIAASVVIDVAGIRGALVIAGAVPVLAVLATGPLLLRVDDRALVLDADLRLLDAVRLFRPLQLAVKEELAAEMDHSTVRETDLIVRQGETGDRFFIIEDGEVRSRSIVVPPGGCSPATRSARSHCCGTCLEPQPFGPPPMCDSRRLTDQRSLPP